MSDAVTPSPVRQVKQFERDEHAALELQRHYDDEVRAQQMQAEVKLEDEFDSATRSADDKRSEAAVKRMA